MILDLQQRHVDPDVSVLEFAGRLQLGGDLGAAEHRIRRLVEAGRKNLVFDFSKLEHIDHLLRDDSQADGSWRFVIDNPWGTD